MSEDDDQVAFRIERTLRPSVSRWAVVRALILAVAGASVLSAAGLELYFFVGGLNAQQAALQLDSPYQVPEIGATPGSSAASVVGSQPELIFPTEPAVPSLPTLAPPPQVPGPATLLDILVDERFTSNVRNWPNDPEGATWLGLGSYHLAARQVSHFVAVGIPGTRDLSDVVVTGWFRKIGGPPGGGYGLILRDQEPDSRNGQSQSGHYYVFVVGDRGEVGIWLRDDDHWVDLLTWTPFGAVRPGQLTNELSVSARGDELSFLVNGIPVASQTDTQLHIGAAGVYVGGDGNEVTLDRVTVSVPR